MKKQIAKKTSHKKFQIIMFTLDVLFVIKFLLVIIAAENIIQNYSLYWLVLFLLSFMVISPIAKITHEIGHLLFGKILGYQFYYFQTSLFVWHNEQDKVRFSLRFNPTTPCVCCMAPPLNASHKQRACYYFSGMIFNTFILILIFSCLLFTNYFLNPVIYMILATANLVYEIEIVKALLPYTDSAKPSDGEIGFALLKQNTFAKQMSAIDEMNMQLLLYMRPRDLEIDESLFEGAKFYILTLFTYYKALDSNDTTLLHSTISFLESHIDEIDASGSPVFYYELVYYYSAIKKDADKANFYFHPIKHIIKYDYDVNAYRVLASYEFYINHNKEKALHYIAKAIVAEEKFQSKGQLLMEKDLLAKLQKTFTPTKTKFRHRSNYERYSNLRKLL